MSRYIDADALHKAYMELRNFKQDPQSGDWISLRAVPLTAVIRMLNEAPTIEPKRGEWKRRIVDNGFNADWVCSECDYRVKTDFVDYNFCPNCGADMRKESE